MQPPIKIEPIKPDYAEALEELQRICLPTLGEDELLLKKHFLKHCEIFPEGNFVAIADEKIVGLGSGFLCHFDFDHPQHSFMEFIDYGFYTNHDPNGEWYYGADISVHPDYRRRGIGGKLYRARKGVVKRLNKRGIIGGGLIPTFAEYKDQMDVYEYVEKVVAGEIYGQTLTFQLNNGFEVRGLIEDYLLDEASDNWSTLIVWDNPDYKPEE
ncbi:MAG: GNAT family N-acetyltransferase [Anaerolineae bacterium]